VIHTRAPHVLERVHEAVKCFGRKIEPGWRCSGATKVNASASASEKVLRRKSHSTYWPSF